MGFSINSSRHEVQEDFQNPPTETLKSFLPAFSNSPNTLSKMSKMYHKLNISISLISTCSVFFHRKKKIVLWTMPFGKKKKKPFPTASLKKVPTLPMFRGFLQASVVLVLKDTKMKGLVSALSRGLHSKNLPP